MVREISNVVKQLPVTLGVLARQMENLKKEVLSIYPGSTIIEELKSMVKEISDFVDGVQSDVLDFYSVGVFCFLISVMYIRVECSCQ